MDAEIKLLITKMDTDTKEILKQEKEIKRFLAHLVDDHEKWLKRHDIRLNEHWKHITK